MLFLKQSKDLQNVFEKKSGINEDGIDLINRVFSEQVSNSRV